MVEDLRNVAPHTLLTNLSLQLHTPISSCYLPTIPFPPLACNNLQSCKQMLRFQVLMFCVKVWRRMKLKLTLLNEFTLLNHKSLIVINREIFYTSTYIYLNQAHFFEYQIKKKKKRKCKHRNTNPRRASSLISDRCKHLHIT